MKPHPIHNLPRLSRRETLHLKDECGATHTPKPPECQAIVIVEFSPHFLGF